MDDLVKLYEPEIKRHYQRWGQSYNNYLAEIKSLKSFAQNRKPPNNRQKNIDFLPKMINFAGEKA